MADDDLKDTADAEPSPQPREQPEEPAQPEQEQVTEVGDLSASPQAAQPTGTPMDLA